MADNQSTQQLAQQRVREQRANNFYDMFVLNEGNKSKVYKKVERWMKIN